MQRYLFTEHRLNRLISDNPIVYTYWQHGLDGLNQLSYSRPGTNASCDG